jgi:hypothetical protein
MGHGMADDLAVRMRSIARPVGGAPVKNLR